MSESEQKQNDAGWSAEIDELISRLLGHYPDKMAALLPVLTAVQREKNWLSLATMDRIAECLELSPRHVYGVATFYTMYNKRPVGRFLIQVCTNISCGICGGDDVMQAFLNNTGTEPGETSKDGNFTVIEAECLAGCGFPTTVQINSRYYENVMPKDVPEILERLKARGE